MNPFTKEGKFEDYNLTCPDCGAIYYERPRRTEEIIKHNLYMYGRVLEGRGPCFIPSCPGCGKSGYKHFTPNNLKPRSLKGPGKIIRIKNGDIGPCYQDFTYIKLDWGYPEESDVEKKKLVEGMMILRNSYRAHRGIHIYANFPEYNTAIHFTVTKGNILETISVFGRVSREDAEIFVKDLIAEMNKTVH